MRKASVAEWIISGFTDRHRAAAIVGDLLESTSPKSALRFWCPVAGIVFSLVWRRTIAFVAAFYLCLRWMGPLTMRIWGTTHRPPETWMGVFGGLCGIATLLWAIFPYAIVRFGIRDRLARLAGAFTVLSTVLIYFWWISAVAVACLAACVAIVVGSMFSQPWRKALLALSAAYGLALCGVLILLYLQASYQTYLDPTMATMPSSTVLTTYFPILMMFSVTSACSFAHRLLLCTKGAVPE
jgi:hypothetical protein